MKAAINEVYFFQEVAGRSQRIYGLLNVRICSGSAMLQFLDAVFLLKMND
jgi:hypothetical protein